MPLDLQPGRRSFPCRRAISAAIIHDASARSVSRSEARPKSVPLGSCSGNQCSFSRGKASQYPPGPRTLHSESVFREAIDRCAAILAPQLAKDLRALLIILRRPVFRRRTPARVTDTIVLSRRFFSFAYASLQQLWNGALGWHLKRCFGHSIGESWAALAGVFTLEDALAIVVNPAYDAACRQAECFP